MKTKLIASLSIIACLALTGCDDDPLVVAGGDKAVQLDSTIDAQLAAVKAADAAKASALSKVSASAGAVATINATTPDTAARQGIAGEADSIQTIAGKPTEADRLAASERARVVAEGQRDKIAAQYQQAEAEAKATVAALAQSAAALNASNAALAQAKLDAEAERQAEALAVQRRIDKIVSDAKAAQRSDRNWIFFGGGALFELLGTLGFFYGAEIPIFGKKLGIALWTVGGLLIVTGIVIDAFQDFIDAHTWFVPTCLIAAACLVVFAIGLAVSNHYHDQAAKAEVTKIETTAASWWSRAKAVISKIIAWVKALFKPKTAQAAA